MDGYHMSLKVTKVVIGAVRAVTKYISRTIVTIGNHAKVVCSYGRYIKKPELMYVKCKEVSVQNCKRDTRKNQIIS